MRSEATSSIRSVERSVAVLELLDRGRRRWNISEIGRILGMPKSTAHTIVVTLERLGYVARETSSRRYGLGVNSYCLGRGTIQGFGAVQATRREMELVAGASDMTVHLAVLDGDQAIYIQKVEARDSAAFDTAVGRRMCVHATALGKVLLAYSKPEYLRKFFSRNCFARYTNNTITSTESLRDEMRNIRARQYAIEDQEEQLDVRCLAVPVLDAAGVTAALGVAALVRQLPVSKYDRVARILQLAAANIATARTTAWVNGKKQPDETGSRHAFRNTLCRDETAILSDTPAVL